ncbi:MAG TPA: hypothetical protein ENN35_05105 [Deltaproteobacteria bacterium]|nr:hypothetical protein [Deltaproteobacteria bacterium]
MREVLSLATYLVVWLLCDLVIGFESGFVSLMISLGAAIGIFFLIAVKDKSINDDDDDDL